MTANAGEWNRAWRSGHEPIHYAQPRHVQAVRVAEVRHDYAVAQAQRALQAEVCAQQAAVANATAIQLACGAAPEDVVAQNIVVNQQLAAYNAAKQYQLQNSCAAAGYVAPVCR